MASSLPLDSPPLQVAIGTLPSPVTKACRTTPPTANAAGPYAANEGGSVVLNGTGSSDPDQSSASLTYAWDLDGDNVFGETGAGATRGNETGSTPTFSAAGLDGPNSYIVKLRVTDNANVSAEN